ncbi:unnamed protein product [Nippostrongylus brasiliensis]|uniref:Secreted protein n=1 Tax=Nippostrongylus brasiliensis TaxID=27835 RepID=A0A0N4Y4M5_NIPBR|nr:unnamed protein product [Nippostrongylus brasiliensis]
MIQQITILALLSTCAAHIIDRRDPKDRPTPLSDSRLIDNYEQWLMNQFVAQLDETLPHDPTGPEMDRESQKTMGNRNTDVNDGYGSHTISTTLEMFTKKPLNEKSGKLITADDMKLFDPPVAPIEKKETSHLDTVVREREHSEIWTRRETGPLTATTTLETLYRV